MPERTLLRSGIGGCASVFAAASRVTCTQPLGAALLVLPLVGIALLPWPVSPLLIAAVIFAGLLGGIIPALPGADLRARYHGTLVFSAHMLRCWGMFGIALCAAALALRGASWWTDWRAGALVGSIVFITLLLPALPLGMLYLPHHTNTDAPELLHSTTCTDMTIIGADGVRLDARLYIPADREWHGLVVFTHGFSGWKEGFLNHLNLFTHCGWAVLAYDLRGCGRSSPAACSYGAHEQNDLVAVWQVAQRLADARPLVAYGVSLGGAITRLAAARLDGCRAVALESPFADLGALLDGLGRPVRVLGGCLTRFGLGWDPRLVKPAAAPLPQAPLLVGWTATDPTIPPAQSAQVAHTADADTIVMPDGAHLDLITYAPWRHGVIAHFNQAIGRPPPDGAAIERLALLSRS